MLTDSSRLISSFQDVIKKSEKECGSKLEEIRELIYSLNYSFGEYMLTESKGELAESLTFWCFIQSTENAYYAVYLSYCGLYRNAFDNIRHILESVIQAIYVDINHPASSLETKIEILKEIEDKKEYHASRLIQDKLDFKNMGCEGLDCKGLLNTAYKELSQMVHPSHEKVMAKIDDLMRSSETTGILDLVDCSEVARIFDSMRIVLDVFFFLLTIEFPNFREAMGKDKKFNACVKKYNLPLLSKVRS